MSNVLMSNYLLIYYNVIYVFGMLWLPILLSVLSIISFYIVKRVENVN